MTHEEALRLGRAIAREVKPGAGVEGIAKHVALIIEREYNRFDVPDPRSFTTMLRLLAFAYPVIEGKQYPLYFAPKIVKWLKKAEEVMDSSENYDGGNPWPR